MTYKARRTTAATSALASVAGLAVLWLASPSPSVAAASAQAQGIPHTSMSYVRGVPDQVYGASVYVYADRADLASEQPSDMTVSAGPASVCAAAPAVGGTWIRMVGVGTCTATATPPDVGADPGDRPVEHSFAVTKAPLVIAAVDTRKAYDEPTPPLTATYTGLRNGDTPAEIVGVQLSGPSARAVPGRYPITVSGGPSPHYAITFVAGQLTVDPVVRVIGLPADIPPTWIVDRHAITAARVVLAYASHVDYAFGAFRVSHDGTMFITTTPNAGEKIVENLNVYYVPMSELIDDATDNVGARISLKGLWRLVEHPRQPGSVENSLHAFADAVRRLTVSGYVSAVGERDVLGHAQAVYAGMEFHGRV